MYKFLLLATVGTVCCYGGNAVAKTTFLPDWQMADLEFQRDEPLCQDAVDKFGNKLYHKASGCPAPKVFDEHCAHDDRYISECYCPAHYQYNCVSPYRGDERVKKNGYASCDGLYIACCDGSCPGNTSKSNPGGCGGSTTNDCGDTCYYPYQPCCYPSPSETGCTCGSYSCSDGCGGTRTCCSSCPTPPPASSSSSSSSSGSSSSGSGSSGSSSSGSSGSSSSGGGSSGSSGGSSCVSGGSASCSGATSCSNGYTSSCMDCDGTTRYTCNEVSVHTHSYSCPSGSQSDSCGTGYDSSMVSKTCSCGAVGGGNCYVCTKCDSSYNLTYSQAYSEPAEYISCGGLFKRGDCYPEAYLSGGICVYDCRKYDSCIANGGSCDTCRTYSNAPECEKNSGCM